MKRKTTKSEAAASKTKRGAKAEPGGDATTSNSRKKAKALSLEEQVKALEEENLALTLQLKVGKESTRQDSQLKDQILAQIESALQQGKEGESELKGALKSYVVRFSDSSNDHEDSADNHMSQIQRLLNPTKVTKLTLWILNQDEEFFRPVLDGRESLFAIVGSVLEATLDQWEEVKTFRESSRHLVQGMRASDRDCEDLRMRIKRKNRALAEEVLELQDILTPEQMGKFVLWANRNQALQDDIRKEWKDWMHPMKDVERSAKAVARSADGSKMESQPEDSLFLPDSVGAEEV